ncbi:MAG: TspO/MBR family protein [Candidatus Berkelbacteria bacterium]
MKIPNWGKAIIIAAGTFGAGALGSAFTFSQIPGWYATLNKTVISPPNWVFGPVWTLLYIMMGVAAFLVWRETKEKQIVKEAMQLNATQLILNALWSILFFGGHLLGIAYLEIIALLVVIILTTRWYFKINKVAGYMMLPYIVWVAFASFLNLFTWLANR